MSDASILVADAAEGTDALDRLDTAPPSPPVNGAGGEAVELGERGPEVILLPLLDANTVIAQQERLTLVIDVLDLKNPKTVRTPDHSNSPVETPFDLDAGLIQRAVGQAAEVLITINDDDVTFVANQRYVTAGDEESALVLRGMPAPEDPKHARFYILRSEDAEFQASFNLGLVIRGQGGAWSLPIYLDPKIENVGG